MCWEFEECPYNWPWQLKVHLGAIFLIYVLSLISLNTNILVDDKCRLKAMNNNFFLMKLIWKRNSNCIKEEWFCFFSCISHCRILFRLPAFLPPAIFKNINETAGQFTLVNYIWHALQFPLPKSYRRISVLLLKDMKKSSKFLQVFSLVMIFQQWNKNFCLHHLSCIKRQQPPRRCI